MPLICGACAVGKHERCDGFLNTEWGFCACWTRQHQPKPDADDPAVRARNDAIYLEYVRQTLHAGEA